MRSSEVPVRILPFAPFGAPPPLIFLEANAFVQWLGKARAQKNAPREQENSSLRAKRSNPGAGCTGSWIASSRSLSSGRPLRAGPVGSSQRRALLSAPARRGTPQNSLANFVGTPSRGRGAILRSKMVEGARGGVRGAEGRSKLMRQRRGCHPHPIALRAIDLPPPGGGEEVSAPARMKSYATLAMRLGENTRCLTFCR